MANEKFLKEKAKEYLSNNEPDFEKFNYGWVYENVCKLVEFYQLIEKELMEKRYESALISLTGNKEFKTLSEYETWFLSQWDTTLLKALKIATGIEED